MSGANFLGRALCSLVLACSAQDVRLTGPITGLIFDGPSRSLRQVIGMPGAALLGPAILSDVDWGTVSPSGRAALVLRDGEVRLFSAGREPAEAFIQGAVNTPLYSAWAADSSAVALYSAAGSSVQWIRLTAAGPVADPAIPLSWTGPGVTAFAADDQSLSLILAVAGAGVYRVGPSSDPVLLLPLADVSALALEPGGRSLWISDRTNAQLLQITDPLAAAEPQVVATDAERLADISAIAISSDRKSVYLAGRSTRQLYLLDRSSALLSAGVDLYAAATMFKPLGRSSVLLLGQRANLDESLYLLDEAAGPAVYFVPVVEEK